MDTLQTQWSWILQITKCIDVHLKENAAYFQVSSEVENSHQFCCVWIASEILFLYQNALNPCTIMHNTPFPYCKCYFSARWELGFLMKGICWFLADVFKSCEQLKSQLFSCSSSKRPKPQNATWKTFKTPSGRSSSVIKACRCSLCWSRSKSWRYCHTRLAGYVLPSLAIRCPPQIPVMIHYVAISL